METPYETMRQAINAGTYDKKSKDFRLDLFKAYGLMDNSKADKAYSIAWDNGHAYGYMEVLSHFDVLVDLIK